jgi:pimeloyl-ACP methyl ester carboxylesterase/acyl carrier protein
MDTTLSMHPGASSEAANGQGENVDAIARLFAEILDLGEAGADDDFFELGGDSLNAASLMTAIETRFGVWLAVSVILQATTPRKLADWIAGAQPKVLPPTVIPVQESGDGAALFVIPGRYGDVVYARQIAGAIGPTRPVYGIRAFGSGPGEAPIFGIPQMAAQYVSDLRSAQPKGPYILHGYCGGSFVAYEIAQQLRRAGEEVKGLIMIDPPLDWRRSPFLVASGPWLDFLQLAATVRLDWAKLRSHFRFAEPDKRFRSKTLARVLWCSLSHYEPDSYPGEVLVIHSGSYRRIMFNRERGLQHLMPNARFQENGEAHHEVFATSASTLSDTREFVERVDPSRKPSG